MHSDDVARPPVLEGGLEEEAQRTLEALSFALAKVDVSSIPHLGLAQGASGLALAHAYLHPVFPEHGHAEAAGRALEATARLTRQSSVPWLLQGVAGAGWVIDHLTRDDPEPGDPNAAVEAALVRLLARTPAPPFEYMRGVAGLAVFGLGRAGSPSARALLDRVAGILVAQASPRRGGRTWLTDPAESPLPEPTGDPLPYENYGFAHGAPGVIAAISALLAAGVARETLRPLLDDATRALLASRFARPGVAAFPFVSRWPDVPSRAAWCAGDPGIAWSLLLAGRALDNAELVGQALAIGEHAAARPFASTGVEDAGFCHGSAGLAHLFHRMYAASGRATLRQGARDWIERTLAMRDTAAPLLFRARWHREKAEERTDEAGLLFGAAGIALVLATALGKTTMNWDAPLTASA